MLLYFLAWSIAASALAVGWVSYRIIVWRRSRRVAIGDDFQ
jgi:hypothetical protein